MADENRPTTARDTTSYLIFGVPPRAAWFGIVEAQFLIRGTEAQRDKFALVTAVLPETSARRVAHILAAPGEECYDDLKTALLAAHQLTSYQKAERLFSAEALGERRPSELLSEMLELVHPGEERTRLFSMLFLRRLPPAVRLQLTEDDHEDVRALAEKADRCAASIHRHQQTASPIFSATTDNTPEVKEQEEFLVTAVGSGRGSRGAQGSQDAAASAPSSSSTQPSPPPLTPRISLQGRHLACAGRISVTATRPTAAAATAPGRETSCPGRCTRRPPGQTGFPKGSVIRRPLLSRYRRYSVHHPWPNFFWWPGADRRKRRHHRHWCRADFPAGLQRQQVPPS